MARVGAGLNGECARLALLLTNLRLILSNVALLVGWHEEAGQQLRDQTITDFPTTVPNRRGWDEAGARGFAQARRHRQPLALLQLDLDALVRRADRALYLAKKEAGRGRLVKA